MSDSRMTHVERGAPPTAGPGPGLAAQDRPEPGELSQGAGEARIIVLTAPLRASEWEMIRGFVGKVSRENLRLRFGQAVDFRDEATLQRFFDIPGATGEMLWALDERGEISGILHRVVTGPGEAEVALIVRTDRQRRGIGRALVRTALARAAKQNLRTLRALILRENLPMLRLAKTMGLVPKKSAGLSVEVEFDLTGEAAAHRGRILRAA
jgi:acetyltransferase